MIRRVTVEADDDTRTVRVTDEKGITRYVQGAVVFAGDAEMNDVLYARYGSAADCAWAASVAWTLKEKGTETFFGQLAAHIVQRMDPEAFVKKSTAQEILAAWEDDRTVRTH